MSYKPKHKAVQYAVRSAVLLAAVFFVSAAVYIAVCALQNPDSSFIPPQPVKDTTVITPLCWNPPQPDFDISAQSAIMIDFNSGAVIYQKNSTQQIPPASMAKLVTIAVIYEAVKSGEINLADTVPLPPESWLRNLPPRSSGMCLERGQIVTAEELMKGMAVASGNDAAIALAHYVSGSVASFCDRMNSLVESIGLVHTHFVEPSGLSEHNVTTAAEFVRFCRYYITQYPESLDTLHSVVSMTYPLPRNMPKDGSGTFYNITQHNTNKLLSLIDGCDGLKTGYIDESGYNIALTVQRGSMRIIAVLMGCPGLSTAEGNRNRYNDGKKLTQYAYRFFDTVEMTAAHPVPVCVIGGDIKSGRYVYASESMSPSFCIPAGSVKSITRTLSYEPVIDAPVQSGDIMGNAVYSAHGTVIGTIPLTADRSIACGSPLHRFYDSLFRFCRPYIRAESAD